MYVKSSHHKNINVFWLGDLTPRSLSWGNFSQEVKSSMWEDTADVFIKVKKWWARKKIGIGVRCPGFEGFVSGSATWYLHGLGKVTWSSWAYICQDGRREIILRKSHETRLWRILTAKPRSPGSMLLARGTLQVFDHISASGKLTQWWRIRWMEWWRRWRWEAI